MENILEVCQVDQVFRTGFWLKKVQILHGIDLTLSGRSTVGLVGANGAGKTTLLHLIVGLRKPTRGHVKIFGFDAQTFQARAKIGYLPERPYFHEHLTGEGMLKYFGALSGLSSKIIQSRIPTVLARVGMEEARRVELRRYSKGMLQRIGIAQALIHDPELLVLDEPMSGLDPVGRKEIRKLLTQLASEGRTVLFSSHIISDVEAVCDRVVAIEKGRLIASGTMDQFLTKEESLENIFQPERGIK